MDSFGGNNRTYNGIVCYPADATANERFLVTYGGFWFNFVFAFGEIIVLFDNSLFMILATLLLLLGMHQVLRVFATAIEVPRPVGYDAAFCGAEPFAFPDARFVTVMIFSFVVMIGVYYRRALRHRVSTVRTALIIARIIAYCASTIVSRYFDYWLLAANMVLVLLGAPLYWLLYRKIGEAVLKDVGDGIWRSRLDSFIGLTGAHKIKRKKPIVK